METNRNRRTAKFYKLTAAGRKQLKKELATGTVCPARLTSSSAKRSPHDATKVEAMRRFDKLQLRFRSLFRRAKVENELDREMQFHLDEQIHEYMNAGMDADEARFTALREIGNIAQLKEECRNKRGLRLIDELARNLHYAIRALHKIRHLRSFQC